MNRLLEATSYENRINNLLNELKNRAPFKNKMELLQTINELGESLRISEYSIGGAAWKDFIKDTLLAMKQKGIKAGRARKNLSPEDSAIDFLEKKRKQVIKKDREDKKLREIAHLIVQSTGEAYPDGDPIDLIIPAMIRTGYIRQDAYGIYELLDKATKKHTGSTSYNNFLADFWDQLEYEQIRADGQIEPNPWR